MTQLLGQLSPGGHQLEPPPPPSSTSSLGKAGDDERIDDALTGALSDSDSDSAGDSDSDSDSGDGMPC